MREQSEPISPETIETEINRFGYYYLPGVGKLRAHTLSRGWLVGLGIIGLVILTIFYGASNLRVAMAQMQTARAQADINVLRSQAQTDQRQMAQCMTTLLRYQAALNQATASAQQAAPTNPNAAQILRLLTLLKAVL
jgi:hypothetical protein